MRKKARHDIIHISKARRLHCPASSTEPLCAVRPLWAFNLTEEERIPFAEADLRADLDRGDPFGWVLRKANHVIENASIAFLDGGSREELLRRTVGIIRDHGDPVGVRLLRKALDKHGHLRGVRAAVSEAASRIGEEGDLDLLIRCVREAGDDLPSVLKPIAMFASRHPGSMAAIGAALQAVSRENPGASESVARFLEGLGSG